MNEIKVGDYVVRELTLGALRHIQMDEVSKADMQYHIACACVTKPDGSLITMEELNGLGARFATRLLSAVAELNIGGQDEKGND